MVGDAAEAASQDALTAPPLSSLRGIPELLERCERMGGLYQLWRPGVFMYVQSPLSLSCAHAHAQLFYLCLERIG